MPRHLTFKIKKREFTAVPVRIDRKKLYGWTEILALDDNGEECRLMNTDDSGSFIISMGSTGLGILTPDGRWVERSELIAVDEQGNPVPLIPSSYGAVITLKERISTDDFLDHSITAFYKIEPEEPALLKAIGNDIYTFPYIYLDGYEATTAILITGDDGNLYMMLGYRNQFEMLSLEQPGAIEMYDNEEDDQDGIDFSMF